MGSNFDQQNLLKALSPSTKSQYTRVPERFICRGLDLVSPVDNIPPGKYPRLRNVRAYRDFIQPRPGIASVGNTGSGSDNFPVHSIRRLNDETQSDFTMVVGSGTRLFTGKTGGFTQQDAGFSGDPLSMVPFRPTQSPRPWMYVADRSRMRKVRQDGTDHEIGVSPPGAPPSDLALDTPDYKDIDDFDYADNAAVQAAWIEGGDAGNPTQLVRVNTTMTAILYDRGIIGWACVQPAALTNIEPGMRLIIDNGGGDEEDVTVQSVHSASTSTTIASIIYDSGTDGLCSIALTTPVEEIRRDSLIFIASTERVRVLSTTLGPDGTQSIRCFTTATRAATNALVALVSFRAYFTNTHAATEDIDGLALTCVFTNSTGKGTLTNDGAVDLSLIATGQPAQPDDILHVSLRFDLLNRLIEGRILIDIDDDNFDQNYFVYPFRPDDLVPAISGDELFTTGRETVVAREEVDFDAATPRQTFFGQRLGTGSGRLGASDFPGVISRTVSTAAFVEPEADGVSTSQEIDTGDNQWQELVFRIKDLIRVGTNRELTLKDAASIRIELTISDSVTVNMDSWWLGGGRGPVQGHNGAPYVYRYRGRVSLTGAKSNFSPVTRTSISPQRQEVFISLPGHITTEVDRLDVSRFGGDLLEFHYVGTTNNFTQFALTDATNAGPIVVTSVAHGLSDGDFVFVDGVVGNIAANGFWTVANKNDDDFELEGSVGSGAYSSGGTVDPAFKDNFRDRDIVTNPVLANDSFQPWPTVGVPVSGTTTSVAGTTVKDSGSNFVVTWAPGTVIHLDGVPFVIYRVISTSLLELVGNAGTRGVISWDIFEPVLEAQPLPTLWGPFEGYMFACGDPNNPGLLYFSNPNDPDGTTEAGKIEVTSPSEPLMNGGMYNGRAFLFSTERMFFIYPAFNEDPAFRVVEVPNSKGMFSRWFLAVGPKIWFGAKDGIYETVGGEPRSITDEDLYTLFPHEGQPGEDVNGVEAPDMAQPTKLRLSYYDSFLYFDYRATASTSRTLVYDSREKRQGWFYDEYSISSTIAGAVIHYGDEGKDNHRLLIGMDRSNDGSLYQITGAVEDSADLDCQIRTPSRNEGDSRVRKRYGDVYTELDGAGNPITVEVGRNSHQEIIASGIITLDGRDGEVIDINDGKGELCRDLSVDYSWSSQLTPKLYLWERSLLPRPEDVSLRGGDYEDAGSPGTKFVQGIIIEADTKGVDRTIQVQYDNDVNGPTITANHNGRIKIPYSFATPFHAHKMRLLPTDVADWRLFDISWVWEPAPELVKYWITQPTSHDLPGYQHLRDAQIALISTDEVLLTVNYDDKSASFTINSTGGVFLKQYVPFTVMKAKVYQYKFSSATGFRLFAKDSEVRVKPWGSQDPYATVRPFGGESRRVGAII